MCKWLAVSLVLLCGAAIAADDTPVRTQIGRPISESDATRFGESALPSGAGLPTGRGTAKEGSALYAAKCAACHGDAGEGRADFPALVGGRGSLATDKPLLTVGSYWPTATTIFDYVNRAMPYQAPGSLTADETYAITAWILAANEIIKADRVIDRSSLPQVQMPNRSGFVKDQRITADK